MREDVTYETASLVEHKAAQIENGNQLYIAITRMNVKLVVIERIRHLTSHWGIVF